MLFDFGQVKLSFGFLTLVHAGRKKGKWEIMYYVFIAAHMLVEPQVFFVNIKINVYLSGVLNWSVSVVFSIGVLY